MEDILEKFEIHMKKSGKSENTRKSYLLHINGYLNWFKDTYNLEFKKLYRENVLEYKSYLLNVKRYKGKHLNGKTINAKLSALKLLNKYLIMDGIQEKLVITNEDLIKIQRSFENVTDIDKLGVETFRQKILEDNNRRLYALVTLIAYTGLRISETLNIKLCDMNLESKEIIVRNGKGEKQRLVYINSKIVSAIREYLKFRNSESEFLFSSRESDKIDRSVINKEFKKYSKNITPHSLRHFYCTHALETGFSIHEVSALAGHSSVQTTLLYSHGSRKEMKEKSELL